MIRLAENHDGPFIEYLVGGGGDWSDIYPFWLISEEDGHINGVAQVCISKPVGRVENLVIEPTLEDHEIRGKIYRELLAAAGSYLKQHGIAAIAVTAPFENKQVKRLLKRNGGVTKTSGNILEFSLE